MSVVLAETVVAPSTTGWQAPVPLQAPPQPLKGRATGSCTVAVQVALEPWVTGFGVHCALAMPASVLTVTMYWRGARQAAVVPPLMPAQFQRKASDAADWLVAEPALHKRVGKVSEGAVLPHAPLVGGGAKVALMVQLPVMVAVV